MKRSLLPCVFLVACGAEPPLPPAPPAPAPVQSDAAVSAAPAFVPPLPYPASRRQDQVDDLHGTKVADPYRWLEDGSSDEVKQWASAQDALARSTLAKLPGRQAIADRMKQLLYIESAGRPEHAGNRWMYSRKDAGKEKAIVYWREGRAGAEKVLLDPLSWSSDGSVSLGVWTPTFDGKRWRTPPTRTTGTRRRCT